MSSIEDILRKPSTTQKLTLRVIAEPSTESSVEEKETLNFQQTCTFIEEPTTETWQLLPLYHMTAIDSMAMWQIGFNGTELVIMHGYISGIKQTKSRDVTTNSSGRTLQQQALQEARQRYWKMYHKGYRPAKEEVPLCLAQPKPMLANKYEPKKIKTFPVVVQAKLDGVRSLANVGDNGDILMRSRENRQQPWLDHIRQELKTFFIYLPQGCHLDGELYSSDMSFNHLISAVRTTKTLHPRNKDVKYHVFDIILPILQEEIVFENRYNLLSAAYNQYIEDGHPATEFTILPATLINSHEEVRQYHDIFVKEGYEGAIVRKLGQSSSIKDAIYRSSRCNNILKVKDFIDEEGKVISVTEGSGTEKGLAMLNILDGRGNTFPVRPRGSFEQRRIWFESPNLCLGKMYTYRYFELTSDFIPRFPTGVAFRDYE